MPDELRVSPFDPAVLLAAEAEVVVRTAMGEVATFPDAGASIRAAFLRHLLLGLPATPEPWPIRLPGVRIRGARIEGMLDLADCAGPDNAGLPALALEACELAGPLDLSNARLARLSLRGSRIGEVRARGVRIDGAFDFAAVAPLDGAAWIDAHAAVIAGDLLGRGAHLASPPSRPGVAHRDARYALRLSGAQVQGSIDLMGGVVAEGGIALDTAYVRGDVVARGAHVTAGEGDAIGAQAARFDGVVILADGFTADGVIWLMGAHIAGTFDMNGARLTSADSSGVVLAADTAIVGGSVLLRNGFAAAGGVSLRGAKLASSLECDGASIANATADGTGVALAADHAEIGGAVLLRHGFTTRGGISLIAARIGGNLECDGATLLNRTEDGTGVALAAENAVIGGAVLLRHGFTAQGSISLLDAAVDSNIECCGAVLENWSTTGSRETLRLTNAETAGDVLLNQGFVSHGYVSLWGGKIGRDLDCSLATFIGPSPATAGRSAAGALVATNLTVAGDVKLNNANILGRLDCEHLQVGGSLIWDGLRFPREVGCGGTVHRFHSDHDAPPRFMLSHATIGAAIMAHDLTAELPLAIDLGGARAGTLDDEGFPAGWGVGRGGAGMFCSLNLDGFVYDRIGYLRADEGARLGAVFAVLGRWASLKRHDHSATWALRLARRLRTHLATVSEVQRMHLKQRLQWVQRQHRHGNEFHPQPYRHLARVLRAQGNYQAARQAAIAEHWATPGSNFVSRVLRPVWGVCFGFGLSPVRATLTVAMLLVLGTGGVWWAWKRAHVLVVNVSYAMTEVSDAPAFHRPGRAQETAGAPPCGKHDILPVFYAMDMMLPVVALHEQERCTVDTRPGSEIWQVLWALYSFLGKVATSLALLTYSGVLKPREEE